MEFRNQGSKQSEGERHSMTRILAGLVLATLLLGSAGGALYGQKVPDPPPAPRITPHPQPDPEDAPEPPEPPEPPESPQAFILNDGTAYLGVILGDVTTEKAQELKLPAVAGAIVNSVQKDSAAAKAGIERGDAIMEFDGIRVRSSAELRRLIRETPAGRTVEMKIVRDGKTRVMSAKLEASANHFNLNIPEIHIPPLDFPEPPSGFGAHRSTLGISADNLTPQLAQYFGVKQGKGVLVSEVTQGGPADKAGLKAGDVIVQVDSKSVSSVEELRAALNDDFTGDTRKVSLTIVRDHHEQTVSADLTRAQTWGKRTSSAPAQSYERALAQAHANADQLRALAESQRTLVQGEVLKQQRQMQGEWQRQLQEQMRSLKDQLKQMQNLHVVLRQDGEI
jgi:membrane-associated protease RseP (regulator of RpoE activity)